MSEKDAIIDILSQTKSSASQKRSALLRKGLSRTNIDELEALETIGVTF